MNMASKWSLILKTHLFYCLVTVITAAGWNTSIEAAYFHIYFFTVPQESGHNCLLEMCLHVYCTLSLRLSVCICRYPEVLHHPSNPSAQCWVHEDGCQVKPLLHLMACKAVSGVWVFKLPAPPPILSPWDCLVNKYTTTGLQGICNKSTPKSVTLRALCVHLYVGVSLHAYDNAQNCAAALW